MRAFKGKGTAVSYPPNWPTCFFCDDPVLDGHLTCGRASCSEADAREQMRERQLHLRTTEDRVSGRLYEGFRRNGRALIRVRDGTTLRALKHRVHHSPTGFEWGYAGSGPADTARSLLWDVVGREVPAGVYQAFKFDVVVGLRDGWVLTEDSIRAWLQSHYPEVLDGRL